MLHVHNQCLVSDFLVGLAVRLSRHPVTLLSQVDDVTYVVARAARLQNALKIHPPEGTNPY